MDSILDQSDLAEIMHYAELAGRQFSAEKERTIIITTEAFNVDNVDPRRIEEQEKHWNDLSIPKRYHALSFFSHSLALALPLPLPLLHC